MSDLKSEKHIKKQDSPGSAAIRFFLLFILGGGVKFSDFWPTSQKLPFE